MVLIFQVSIPYGKGKDNGVNKGVFHMRYQFPMGKVKMSCEKANQPVQARINSLWER